MTLILRLPRTHVPHGVTSQIQQSKHFRYGLIDFDAQSIRMGLARRSKSLVRYFVKSLGGFVEIRLAQRRKIGTRYLLEGSNLRCGPAHLRTLPLSPMNDHSKR